MTNFCLASQRIYFDLLIEGYCIKECMVVATDYFNKIRF